MKKKDKPTQKQIHKENTRCHEKKRVGHRRTVLQARDQLWHQAQPLLMRFDLRDASGDKWIEFAASVMCDAATLYDEDEFQDVAFEPATALHELLRQFNFHVPTPTEFEQLSEEERHDHTSEAQVYAAATFVSPELQRDLLDALVDCRKRLGREKRADTLALAAAVEMLLRSDDRPEIWGTCGILHRMLRDAVQEATAYEEAREEALKAARAIQPDVNDEHDLVEDSPADLAYWQVAEKTPDLADYIERKRELEEQELDERQELDSELAQQLFDPEELEELMNSVVTGLTTRRLDASKTDSPRQDAKTAISQLPEIIKAHISPERFQQWQADLDELIEEGDPDDPKIQHARMLHTYVTDDDAPYWENPAFQQFIFDALISYVLADAEEFDDEDEQDA